MRVRVCTIGVPAFRHDGLVVGKGWTALELEELAPAARAALVEYAGRFVQIHPDDVGELAAIGLGVVGGKLVEVAKVEPPVDDGDDVENDGEGEESGASSTPAFDTTDVDAAPARPATPKRKR